MNFLNDWKNNKEYFSLLELMARLSNLFSDSSIPFLHYRITENLFCKYYKAENLSRSDTAYDAKTESFGVGIKTFTLSNNASTEKVAEFNSISSELKKYKGYDLAYQLAMARNERMKLGQRLYAISDGCYHIIGRVENGLVVFNSSYPLLDTEKIHVIKDSEKSLQFDDGKDSYTFNYSKSTLFKHFEVPKESGKVQQIPVSIIQDPYEILRKLIDTEDYEGKYTDIYNVHKVIQENVEKEKKQLKLGMNYVILPLFSVRDNEVPIRDGLNKWNANGRPRKADEISIAIPVKLDRKFPNFFPDITHSFELQLPDGRILSAKPCEPKIKGAVRGHALQSNPNIALGHWLLRDILQLPEGTIVTKEILDRFGFDSVVVYKLSDGKYKIDVCRTKSYSEDLFDEDGEAE